MMPINLPSSSSIELQPKTNSFSKSEPQSDGNNRKTRTGSPDTSHTHRTKIPSKSKINQGINQSKASGAKSDEIDEYLKLFSRFENKVKEGKVGDKELEIMFKALEDKIELMSAQKKKRLLKMDFMRKHAIVNLNMLKDAITELFGQKDKQVEVFDFFKSPNLIQLLLDKTNQPETYSPMSVKAKGPVKHESTFADSASISLSKPNLQSVIA